jgi:hypothetical protein
MAVRETAKDPEAFVVTGGVAAVEEWVAEKQLPANETLKMRFPVFSLDSTTQSLLTFVIENP